jgi:ABC-type uncharacterized transport system auxiliary subunit
MKKVALLAAGVMVLALAACGSKSQAPKSKTMKPAAPSMMMPAPKASTTMKVKAPKAMTKMAAKSMGKTSSGSKG